MRFSTKLLPSRSGNLGVVQLNHPKALHALTLDMIHAFQDVMAAWENDHTLQAILVKSTEAKRPSFCAGGDVKAVYEAGIETRSTVGKGIPGSVTSDFFRYEYQLNHTIAKCSKPYISIWDGVVMGGGVGISIHGKYRVATENTVLSMPETALGLFPDVGSTFWMPRLLQQHDGMCHYLALTGKRLGAADLVHTGLATHYVPASRLDDLQKALVEATTATTTSSTSDDTTVNNHTAPLVDVVGPVLKSFHVTPRFPEPPQSFLAKHKEEIEEVFGTNKNAAKTTVEDILQTLQAMDTEFARDTLSTLQKMSPISLKITLEGMRRGAELQSIEDCFAMEYRMGQGCLRPGSDFYEGVRAILVDKDQSPKWNPTSLTDVTPEMVESYFAPLPDPKDEWQPAVTANDTMISNL